MIWKPSLGSCCWVVVLRCRRGRRDCAAGSRASKPNLKAIGTSLAAVALVISAPCLVAAQTMYWSSGFAPIALADITYQSSSPESSSQAQLELSGDVEISAHNGTNARLSAAGGDTLVTEYKLEFDGDGSSASGASTVDYTSYESFLNPAVDVTHVSADDTVIVTLYVRASNHSGDVADSGLYSATQTLTASWVGP